MRARGRTLSFAMSCWGVAALCLCPRRRSGVAARKFLTQRKNEDHRGPQRVVETGGAEILNPAGSRYRDLMPAKNRRRPARRQVGLLQVAPAAPGASPWIYKHRPIFARYDKVSEKMNSVALCGPHSSSVLKKYGRTDRFGRLVLVSLFPARRSSWRSW